MPDRDAAFIRDIIHCQYTTIITKSAFAASDGVQGLDWFYRLTHRDDKKYYDSVPPLPGKKYLETICDCHNCSDTAGKGDLDGGTKSPSSISIGCRSVDKYGTDGDREKQT